MALGKDSSYEEIDVDLLQRTIHLHNLKSSTDRYEFEVDKVNIIDIQFWEYLTEGKFSTERVEVKSPRFIIFSSKEKASSGKRGELPDFLVNHLKVTNAKMEVHGTDPAEKSLFMSMPDFQVLELTDSKEKGAGKIPFEYQSYSIKVDSIAVQMNQEHLLTAGSIAIENGKGVLNELQILPQYNKEEFDRRIPYEKDRISLKVDEVSLDSLQFDVIRDTLYLKNPMLKFTGADLDIYRNKLLPDDPREKSLYSKMLRNAPIKLKLDSIVVRESNIFYEEKLKEEGPPARVEFSRIQGRISNLQNTSLQSGSYPETQVQATAFFMDQTEVEMNWSFNVTNVEDKFRMSGQFEAVEGEAMNSLLKPAMGIEATGSLRSTWFTFTGNEEVLKGDVRVDYQKFKLNIMKEEGKSKNKLLTALANLFVDNDGVSREETHQVQVSRDPNRSFWNYIWTGLKKGIIDTLVQF